ncbi:aerobic respiration control sensor protein ArcB [Fibrobacteria bacterium R8-3-H12]
MPIIYSLFKKVWAMSKQNTQVVIVWIAFALMVIASYFFVGNIVRKHLMYETIAALNFSEVQIDADLMEPQTLMGTVSSTIRSMILQGYGPDVVSKYMMDVSNNLFNNTRLRLNSTGLYGLFDVFGNKFLNNGRWETPTDYVPQERIWYKTAVAAKGKVAITPPYVDIATNSFSIACTVRIFDDDNKPLAVLSMNVPIDKISEYIVETHLAEGGYGLLLNEQLEVIAHPYKEELGKPLREWNSGLAKIVYELEEKKNIVAERRVLNYKGDESIVSFRRLENGWYIGIVTPYNKYYQDVSDMMLWFIALGLTLAITLSIIFIRIAAAKEKADLKNRQKSHFLATMSHEIRTPMNAILGIAEIQLQDDSLPPSLKEAFYKISNSGDLLLGIINDILDMSKIEAGKLELTSARYDIPSLINDIVQLNVLYFESKPIEFKLSVDENIPLSLIGDELRIKQVLNNLLSNAFKYTDKGEVSLTVNADYTLREGKPYASLIFCVSDTGQGMTPEQIRKLGGEYYRFNMEANRTTTGTGLGMNIAMKLIQMMDGKISVESKPGKGTTVTVRLPQKIDDSIPGTIGKEIVENLRRFRLDNVRQMKKTSQIVREYMPYGKVLIVDDVESNLYVAQGLMAPYGLSIETASSGFEAVDIIKGGAVFDIIFMDHFMPKMDGIEAAKIIRQIGYGHPIVALTANALTGQADIFMKVGFDGFISKPIDIRQLNATLNKFIRSRHPPEVVKEAESMRPKSIAKNIQPESDTQLIAIFARDAEKTISVLQSLCEKGNAYDEESLQMFIVSTHAMKSALANIGEKKLSKFAGELEQAVRERNFSEVSAKTPEFLKALRTLVEKIVPKEEEDVVDEDVAYLHEKLLVVQSACEAYDKKTAKKALAELNEKKWSHKTKKALEKISEHILHTDFKAVAATVKDLFMN